MSNRMKIKTRRPKLTMQQAIEQLEKIGKYLYFSSTVSIARMEHCVRQLKAEVQEQNLEWNLQVMKLVNAMDHVANRATNYLRNGRKHEMRVNTHPWLREYSTDYLAEGRIFLMAEKAINEACAHPYADFEQKAITVAMQYKQFFTSKMTAYSLMAASWATSIQVSCNFWLNEWEKIGGHKQDLMPAIMMKNQARDLNNVLKELIPVLCELKNEPEKAWWQQYRKAEDAAVSAGMALSEDERFGQKSFDIVTRDWLSYYIGRAVLDVQKTGEVPSPVMQEVRELGRWNGTPLSEKMERMLKELARQVPKTDDPWDVADHLEEHPWTLMEEFVEICITKIRESRQKGTGAERE